MPNLTLFTGPTVEPVSLAEAKLHLRVETSDDDSLITSLIVATRSVCETRLRRALISQTWDLTLDNWGWLSQWTVLQIPNPPLVSVSYIKYYSDANILTTLSSSAYEVFAGTPGRIAPVYGTIWPTTRCQPGSVVIRYVAGYGATAAAVPECIKAAMKLLLGHWYEHRESVDVSIGGTVSPVPDTVDALLAPEQWGAYS